MKIPNPLARDPAVRMDDVDRFLNTAAARDVRGTGYDVALVIQNPKDEVIDGRADPCLVLDGRQGGACQRPEGPEATVLLGDDVMRRCT